MAKFADNTPAILRCKQGKGTINHFAFLPGLSYFASVTPKVPVDRGTTANASAHLIPIKFDPEIASLFKTPNFHIQCSETLVEANIIDSPKGSAVILTNWTGKPVQDLSITLPPDLATKKITRANGQPLKRTGNKITLDLKIADALILR